MEYLISFERPLGTLRQLLVKVVKITARPISLITGPDFLIGLWD